MASVADKGVVPGTCYAPAARMSDEEVRVYVQSMVGNPIIDTLLKSVGGYLAILNEQRQILVANDAFLKSIGIEDVESVLGLRPGEAFQCIHAHEHVGGCGTSEYCATCGVVVAIMTCLAGNEPVERYCSLVVRHEGVSKSLFLNARAYPLSLGSRRLVVLYLQDISEHQRRAVLERAFVTDISGTIAAVLGRSKLLLSADVERGRLLAEDIFQSLIKLAQEVRIQKSLVYESEQEISPILRMTSASEVLSEVVRACQGYPQAQGRRISVDDKAAGFRFKTDAWLLQRVIGGMVLNALEAAGEGEEVRLKAEVRHTTLIFSVWNGQCIPVEVTKRIFQQNFSTHTDTLGRGVGTYFMKVIGEQSLGGKVDFSTSERDGTEFRLSLNVAG